MQTARDTRIQINAVAVVILLCAAAAHADNIIVGTDTGGARVKEYDGVTIGLTRDFIAYPGFTGGVRVAAGDVNGDGVNDIITGAGPGGVGGHVKVFDGASAALINSFFAYDGFAGGVFVATGDVNGDGIDDIVTGADAGSVGGHVKVFDGDNGALLRSFFAYPGFTGGVRVATGDFNGDGIADIIAGAGPGGVGGQIKVFDGANGALINSFFAYDGFAGGVFVAAGDVNGDGIDDIVTGADAGAPAQVKVFDGDNLALLRSFLAYPGFTGGVRVATGDFNGDGIDDIIAGAGPGRLAGQSNRRRRQRPTAKQLHRLPELHRRHLRRRRSRTIHCNARNAVRTVTGLQARSLAPLIRMAKAVAGEIIKEGFGEFRTGWP